MKRKVERRANKYIVPDWCKGICSNAGEVPCVYDCAKERDGRYFLAKPDLTLEDISPFPHYQWRIDTSPKERQIIAGLYLSKIVEKLTGIPEDPAWRQLERNNIEAEVYNTWWQIMDEWLDEANEKRGKKNGEVVVYEAEKAPGL